MKSEHEKREDRKEAILRRLRRTGQGETACLADWEVDILLEYIDTMKRKVEKQE